MPKTPILVITIVYIALVGLVGVEAFFLGLLTALFGLTAYGNDFSRFLVLIFVIACLTFPIALIVSIVLSFIGMKRDQLNFAAKALCIPLPHFAVFACVVMSFFWSTRTTSIATVMPRTAADYYRSGRIFDIQSNYPKAILNFNDAIRESKPGSPEQLCSYLGSAHAYASSGNYHDTIRSYTNYLALSSSVPIEKHLVPDALVIGSIACVQKRMGHFQEALATLEKMPASSRNLYDLKEMVRIREQVHDAMNDHSATAEDRRLESMTNELARMYPTVDANRRIQQNFSAIEQKYSVEAFGYLLRS